MRRFDLEITASKSQKFTIQYTGAELANCEAGYMHAMHIVQLLVLDNPTLKVLCYSYIAACIMVIF